MSFRRTVGYQIIDVFTTNPFEGNPAGVVLDSSALSDQFMKKIAREINISNTTFLSSSNLRGDFQVRFFTPEKEIEICGHSTIATFFSWAAQSEISPDCEMIIIKQVTCAGTLPVYIRIIDGNVDSVTVELPQPIFRNNPLSRSITCSILNLQEEIVSEYPMQIVYDGLSFFEIGIMCKEALLELLPQESDLLELSRKLQVDCIQFFTLDTIHSESAFCSRTFFPILGVYEDPVCGTGNAALASYLIKNGIIPAEYPTTEIIGEQGFSVSREGKVNILVDYNEGSIVRLRIRGKAYRTMEGSIFIEV